jgi:hypothetical protein
MSAKLQKRASGRLGPALLLGLVASASGCGSKQSVSLDAHIESASLSVKDLALGTQLGGGFTLMLKLGDYASQGTHVTVESFSLVGANSNDTLLAPLKVGPDPGTVSVGVGQTKNIAFTVDGSVLLSASDKANLCAGQVVIAGTVTDTLGGGRSIPLRSAWISVSGC